MDAEPSDDVEPPEIAELRRRHYEAFDELTGDVTSDRCGPRNIA